ncbi:MAG: endonuclease III [Ignavibacteria bacterium]|nr:endonuclease III [Ignavibacteria bacterium]MDP3830206.1 endonuclease III [Ignavibacteriaceae bacterium]
MMNLKSTIKKVNSLLLKKYGIPHRNEKIPNSLDILIGTILSQNTNDKNSYKAYTDLKKKYPQWDDVEKLTASQIEKIINVAGLGKQKSNAIKKALTYLKNEKGELSLNYLKKLKDDEILTELTQLEGVGLKTASCVLLFALRRNSCPVDTHVNRTLNRIGIANSSNPEKTFKLVNSQMPEGIAHQFHTNLIRLGREICKPTNPNCTICPLKQICLFEDKKYDRLSDYKVNDFLLLDSIT